MTLSIEDIAKVARLARLRLSPEELSQLGDQLGKTLKYIDILNEVETENVEPMAHAFDVENVFRADVVQPSLDRSVALSNAPKTDGKYFLVPQIIESGE